MPDPLISKGPGLDLTSSTAEAFEGASTRERKHTQGLGARNRRIFGITASGTEWSL